MRDEVETAINGHHHHRNGTANGKVVQTRPPRAPHNLEAELNVIACAVLVPAAASKLVSLLPSPQAFFRDDHREIWRVILEEFAKGAQISAVSLSEALDHCGLGRLANPLASGSLNAILSRSLAPWDVLQHAAIVRQKSMLRDAIEAANEILRDSYSNLRTAEDILALSLHRLYQVAEAHQMSRSATFADLLPSVWRRIEDRQAGIVPGVLTGFFGLDGMTAGFQPGELIILAARPSMGKTALALGICEHLSLSRREPVVFVSLEMGPDSLVERLLVTRARVNGLKVKTGARLSADEHQRLARARHEINSGAPVHVIERPGQNVVQVCAEIRSAKIQLGAALVVVDYAQLIGSDNPRDNEVAAVTKVSKAMKGIGRELEVPVLLLSQLSRGVESRDSHVPRLHDLRGSGSLEQDADLVLFIHRPEYYQPSERVGEADLILAKNRNGPTGEFKLSFEKECMRFQDFIPQAAPPF